MVAYKRILPSLPTERHHVIRFEETARVILKESRSSVNNPEVHETQTVMRVARVNALRDSWSNSGNGENESDGGAAAAGTDITA